MVKEIFGTEAIAPEDHLQPESTCPLVKHTSGQRLQKSHHHKPALQPMVGAPTFMAPILYSSGGARRAILRKAEGILSSEDSAANTRPRLS
ncbi:hypothetical protein EVAR_72217_1 [Eumeta japonica]|uniref:Uncharacterized protein n=1 Tax=Eumeta variegata TaxID=151549 RepID=A0A4C1T1F5_EUMVA|nr:hypothetical protein EVAR_72217_1 [Eumeta japonica]